MGDGRLDVARPGSDVPDQPVPHDDPVRPAIGRALLQRRLLPRRRRHRGRGDARALGGARPALRAGGLSFGLQPSLLSPAEVAEKLPLIDPERILGGLFVPDDGIGKALQAAEALGRGAIATGALQAFGDCEVTGLDTGGGRVRAVHTSRGTIRADHVVLAAGIWGPRVMRLAGRRLPLHPVEHIYALTEPLPELRGAQGEVSDPILRHQDRSMYLRQVGETYGIGSYLHPPLLCAAEDDRAVRPRRASVGARLHPRALRGRARGGRPRCCRRCATSRWRAPSTGSCPSPPTACRSSASSARRAGCGCARRSG